MSPAPRSAEMKSTLHRLLLSYVRALPCASAQAFVRHVRQIGHRTESPIPPEPEPGGRPLELNRSSMLLAVAAARRGSPTARDTALRYARAASRVEPTPAARLRRIRRKAARRPCPDKRLVGAIDDLEAGLRPSCRLDSCRGEAVRPACGRPCLICRRRLPSRDNIRGPCKSQQPWLFTEAKRAHAARRKVRHCRSRFFVLGCSFRRVVEATPGALFSVRQRGSSRPLNPPIGPRVDR